MVVTGLSTAKAKPDKEGLKQWVINILPDIDLQAPPPYIAPVVPINDSKYEIAIRELKASN